MLKSENKKIGKIEKLVEIIATNVFKLTDDVGALKKDATGLKKDAGELKKDMGEVKENFKDVRRDILNLGDRFVSYHTFDSLANRVKVLEEKKK